jgi:hypothetical protein
MPLPHDPYSPQDPYAVDASGAVVDSATETPAASDEVQVPKGTTSELLSWVGDDKERAQRALDAENATDKPRKGLVEELEEILAP